MKASIIICTYNEEETIFNVVAASCRHNPEAEVIVVDDGSTDNTEAVLETLAIHHSFQYWKLQENKGLSYAMAFGLEVASNEVVLFLNADIQGLRKEHFERLIQPVANGETDMVIGTPNNFGVNFSLHPYKSALTQKAMLKEDLMEVLDDIREMRYGIDAYLTMLYQTIGKRINFSVLEGVQFVNHNPAEALWMSSNEMDEEVANSLLNNFDLMMKRIQNQIFKSQNYTRSTITSVQYDLNKRMKSLKERIGEMEPVPVI